MKTEPTLGDGIVIDLQLQEYEIHHVFGSSPKKRTNLEILARPTLAFESGESLTFAARFIAEDADKSTES